MIEDAIPPPIPFVSIVGLSQAPMNDLALITNLTFQAVSRWGSTRVVERQIIRDNADQLCKSICRVSGLLVCPSRLCGYRSSCTQSLSDDDCSPYLTLVLNSSTRTLLLEDFCAGCLLAARAAGYVSGFSYVKEKSSAVGQS